MTKGYHAAITHTLQKQTFATNVAKEKQVFKILKSKYFFCFSICYNLSKICSDIALDFVTKFPVQALEHTGVEIDTSIVESIPSNFIFTGELTIILCLYTQIVFDDSQKSIKVFRLVQ